MINTSDLDNNSDSLYIGIMESKSKVNLSTLLIGKYLHWEKQIIIKIMPPIICHPCLNNCKNNVAINK